MVNLEDFCGTLESRRVDFLFRCHWLPVLGVSDGREPPAVVEREAAWTVGSPVSGDVGASPPFLFFPLSLRPPLFVLHSAETVLSPGYLRHRSRRSFCPPIGLGLRQGVLGSVFELEEGRTSLGFFCGDLWCDLMDAAAKPENGILNS